MNLLEGKTVAMTGGGGALGRCYGLAMAKAGATIAVSDARLGAAQATADAIVKAGGRAIAVEADVTRAATFDRLLDRAESALGPLDVLLNITGSPALSVPVGFSKAGLPLAMQIVGKPFSEALVYRVAQAYERATNWVNRHPPLA